MICCIFEGMLIIVVDGGLVCVFINVGSEYQLVLKQEGELCLQDISEQGVFGQGLVGVVLKDMFIFQFNEVMFVKQVVEQFNEDVLNNCYVYLVLVVDLIMLGCICLLLYKEVQVCLLGDIVKDLINLLVEDIQKVLVG